jgi:hypothetical protein
MLLRPAYLSQKLDRPLPTKDGATLRTIREACDYMTSMGKRRELLNHWQRVAKKKDTDSFNWAQLGPAITFVLGSQTVAAPKTGITATVPFPPGGGFTEGFLERLQESLAEAACIQELH